MKRTLAFTATLILCLCAVAQDVRMPQLGSPASASEAQRTVVVAAGTRWVNVAQGDVVRFVVGSTDFAWKFDGPGARSLDLRQLAPAGFLDRSVTVYVAGPVGHRP